MSHNLLCVAILAFVFTLPSLASPSILSSCKQQSYPFASHFSVQHKLPLGSVPLAYRYLAVPSLLRLLFGSSITRIDRKRKTTYRVSEGRGYWASLTVVEQRPGLSVLEVAVHDTVFFPVSLRGSQFIVRIRAKNTFEVSFRGPNIKHKRSLHARNVYARGLIEKMIGHVQNVLGSEHCSASISAISGICNNVKYPWYGSAGVPQLQPDTKERLSLRSELPNPRVISNALCTTKRETLAPRRINFLMVSFGQFLDHDIVLTPSGDFQKRDASFPVLDKVGRRHRMSFLRSDVLSLPKCCEKDYKYAQKGRGPFNSITSFIDGSAIYGSSPVRTRALRSFKNGKLIMRRFNGQLLLPQNSKRDLLYTLNNADRPNAPDLFAAGDVRANENPVLTSLHTIFVREHNRVCDLLRAALPKKQKPNQTDEWLFQQARRIIAAELQSIVYNEFLPAMLGENVLPPYKGYNANVDATMAVLFTTAAYRWGHSAVRDDLQVRDLNGTTGTYRLQDAFFNPKLFKTEGVEKWLLGAIHASAMDVDLQHADSIRDFLFSPNKRGILDLVALNIQRGRDHRLPSYIAARKIYGLELGFNDIPKKERKRILATYGTENDVDVFIGGLAERRVKGSLLGPLFHRIVIDQFMRLRDGDRYFYKNVQWGRFMGGLGIVKRIAKGKIRLANIIKSNTKIKESHLPSRDGAMRNAL